MSIKDQLHAGIRYFGIRTGFSKKAPYQELVAYHGSYAISGPGGFYTELSLDSVFKAFAEFLTEDEHKNEGLIVQVKQDYGSDQPQEVARYVPAIQALIKSYKLLWRTKSTVPTIEQLRGHIQLIRRFPLQEDFGIDVFQAWEQNGNSDFFSVKPQDPTFKIQDHFKFNEFVYPEIPDRKFNLVKAHMLKAKQDSVLANWYINYASAVSPIWVRQSRDIAHGWREENGLLIEGVNQNLTAYFNNEAGFVRHGTIVMDYPEEPEELLLAMIKTNFFDAE